MKQKKALFLIPLVLITMAIIALTSGHDNIAVADEPAENNQVPKDKMPATLKIALQKFKNLSEEEFEELFPGVDDSARVLAMAEGNDEDGYGYGFFTSPASNTEDSVVLDMDTGEVLERYNLSTDPDATTLGEIKKALRELRGE
ncbi:MAG: hypothetical protein LBM95_01930 [Lactobacillales bacterium]|nr:hypothetical protein [Lactobacillales bacterium]